MRSIRQCVFPAPGPASTSNGPGSASMALRCDAECANTPAVTPGSPRSLNPVPRAAVALRPRNQRFAPEVGLVRRRLEHAGRERPVAILHRSRGPLNDDLAKLRECRHVSENRSQDAHLGTDALILHPRLLEVVVANSGV